jgi:hypothetical protein
VPATLTILSLSGLIVSESAFSRPSRPWATRRNFVHGTTSSLIVQLRAYCQRACRRDLPDSSHGPFRRSPHDSQEPRWHVFARKAVPIADLAALSLSSCAGGRTAGEHVADMQLKLFHTLRAAEEAGLSLHCSPFV